MPERPNSSKNLGAHPYQVQRAITKVRAHDERFLRMSAQHAGDQKTLIDIARQSRAEIAKVFAADKCGETVVSDKAWHDEDGSKH